MARAPPPRNCAPFLPNLSPSGNSPTRSFFLTPSHALPSANSKKPPCASNSPTGNGSSSSTGFIPCSAQHGSRAIRSVNAHVFRSEVAGPVARAGFAGVQIHHHRNVLDEKLVAGGALVKRQRLAAPQHGDACHFDVH